MSHLKRNGITRGLPKRCFKNQKIRKDTHNKVLKLDDFWQFWAKVLITLATSQPVAMLYISFETQTRTDVASEEFCPNFESSTR